MRQYLIDEICELPDDYWWFYGKWRLARAALARHQTRPPRRFLDIGCGGGQWAAQFAETSGATAFGSDSAPEAIAAARENGVLGAVSSTNESPFRNCSFDLVTAFDIMEHIEKDDDFLGEILRILDHGGLALIHVPAHQFLYSYWDRIHGHYRRYGTADMKELLLRAGFRVKDVHYAHVLPLFPAIAVRAIRSLFYSNETPKEGFSEHKVLPPALNRICHSIYDSEAHLRRFVNVPLGLSVIAVAEKP